MNASKIIERAQRLAGRVDVNFNDRCYQFLNEAIENWIVTTPWATLRKTIDLVADGSRDMIFPAWVLRVQNISDKSNSRNIDNRDHWDREATSTWLSDVQGAAFWWRETGMAPVFKQPTVADYVGVIAGVSEATTVHVSGLGLDTGASGTAGYTYPIQEVINCMGPGSGVTSSQQFYEILQVGKPRSLSDVSVSSGGNTLARINKDDFFSRYRHVEFLRRPVGGTIMRCQVLQRPAQIYSANQVAHSSINPEYIVWFIAGLIHKSQNEKESALICLKRAGEILQSRVNSEKSAGDRDWSAMPDQAYWGTEALQSWNPWA